MREDLAQPILKVCTKFIDLFRIIKQLRQKNLDLFFWLAIKWAHVARHGLFLIQLEPHRSYSMASSNCLAGGRHPQSDQPHFRGRYAVEEVMKRS
jgi:hypothetical protein